ncbi:aminoglycoside phosphotransferase family protein [Streptomyces sp. NPDC127190]|uniref:aminoglycoside phosphotransferase family protein n=1 Tax=unclassified Streptomyces TaxID=2593676 RepID=UPI003628EF31
MTLVQPIPAPVLIWAQRTLGPVQDAHHVPRDRPTSRVWQLTGATGRAYLKLAPSPGAFARETRALREVAPGMDPGTAPALLAADPHRQSLLFSAVPGDPVPALVLTPAGQRRLHRQAGVWLRRFHGAPGDLSAQDHRDAAAEVRRIAHSGADHLDRAGDLLGPERQRTVREHAAELTRLGPLPAGYVHGDYQQSNWLLARHPAGAVFAAVDFARARPHAAVADFVPLARGPWADRPDLRNAFFEGYGRTPTAAEELALRCLSALDAVARGVPNGDREVAVRGRATPARREARTA